MRENRHGLRSFDAQFTEMRVVRGGWSTRFVKEKEHDT
jgi:hypothetical protein